MREGGRGGCPGGHARRCPRVDQFQAHTGGERGGGRKGAGASGRLLRTAFRVRVDANLDAVGIADPERGRGASDPSRSALGRAGVGTVVGVVGVDVLPAGPGAGAGPAGADLDAAVELGGRVVPDDAEEGEVAYVPPGQALAGAGAAEGAVAGEGVRGSD